MATEAREVAGGYAERISAAAREVDDAVLAAQLARSRRNQLLVEAVDQGMTQRRAAQLAGIKPPYLVQIIAASYAEQQ